MPALYLRTVDGLDQSHQGFQWPTEVGALIEAPDWNPAPYCGGGLHGLLWGEGDGDLLYNSDDAIWQVVEAHESIDLDGKHKFRSCVLRYRGDREGAIAYLVANGGDGKAIAYHAATAGDHGIATVGDWGSAIAGDGGTATAGDNGTAVAGIGGTAIAGTDSTAVADYGGTATADDCGTATAGNSGIATAGVAGTATAGDWGSATAGASGAARAGDDGTATAGDWGSATAGHRGTAIAGAHGTATADNGGSIIIKYSDGDRPRYVIGYVGEDGIEAGVAYKCEHGKLVRADQAHKTQ
jgi:hypothetical protein